MNVFNLLTNCLDCVDEPADIDNRRHVWESLRLYKLGLAVRTGADNVTDKLNPLERTGKRSPLLGNSQHSGGVGEDWRRRDCWTNTQNQVGSDSIEFCKHYQRHFYIQNILNFSFWFFFNIFFYQFYFNNRKRLKYREDNLECIINKRRFFNKFLDFSRTLKESLENLNFIK